MSIPAEELLRRGVARHREGRIEEAQSLYRRALRLAPHHPDAENLLGVIALQKGEVEAALAHSARALQAAPDHPLFLSNRGAALAAAGRLGEAIAVLRRTLEQNPHDVTSLRNLGQALTAGGQAQAALAPLRAAAQLAPEAGAEAAAVWLALAHAAREAGATEEARAAAARVNGKLAEDARFLLAGLGEAPPPARAPAAYVRGLFDAFAPRFDAELEGALGYRTPALLVALLAPGARARALDLGCGTGLSGAALKPFAARLEGLDLSPRMLEAARAKGLYDALHEADLLEFLPKRRAAYELVAAADVLNYLGDLAPAFAAMRAALKPGGEALFSLEAGEAEVALGAGLRFRHNPAHATALACAAGFELARREAATLRRERGEAVAGALFLLRAR